MKILTWNTKHGRGTRAALAVARALDADAVLLQEAAPGKDWSGPMSGGFVPEQLWGSWMLLRAGHIDRIRLDGYAGWVTGGRVTWPEGSETAETYLFSLHSPTSDRSSRRSSYIQESLRIVRTICAEVPIDVPLVIGGDFNFRSLGFRHASEVLRNTPQERQALHQFQGLGLTLAWQHCHRGEPLPQTLRWSGNPEAPYHCDGYLLRGCEAMTIRCDVLRAPEMEAASDHNPIVLQMWPNAR